MKLAPLRIKVIVIFWLASTYNAFSQNDLRWTSFTVGSDVPGAFIQKFGQDKHGHLWMFHLHGLLRYDGYTFSDYSIANGLSSNHIVEMTTHPNSADVWVSTTTGINLLRHDTFTIPQVHPVFKSRRSHRLFLASNGDLWIGGFDGVFRYDGKAVTEIAGFKELLPHGIRAFAESATGEVVAGTGEGIYSMQGDTAVLLKVERNLRVRKLAFDHQGDLWIVDGAYALYRMDKERRLHKIEIAYDSPGSLEHGSHFGYFMVDLAVPPADHAGQMAVVGLEDIQVIAGDSVIINYHEYPKDVPKQNFLTAYYDREGLLWASFGHQVLQGAPTLFGHYSCAPREENCNAYTTTLYYDEEGDDIYLGSFDGVYKLQDERIVKTFHEKGNDGGETYRIHRDQNGAWWFTDAVLVTRFADNTYQTFFDEGSFGERMCLDMHEFDDAVWIGQLGRISRIRGDVVERISSREMSNKRCLYITSDASGRLWAGTTDGLFVLEADTLRMVERPSSPINKMIARDSMLWIGTSGDGITGYSVHAQNTLVERVRYNRLTGEQFDVINDFVIDDRGRLWIGSMGVLYHIDPSRPDQPTQRFNKDDGYTPYLKSHPAMVIDKHQTLWMGGYNGISTLDINAFQPDTVRPRLHIRNMEVVHRNSSVESLPDPEHSSDPIVLGHQQNNITFNYSGSYFHSPEKINYYYRLSGHDTDWIGPVKTRYKTYTNLRAGKYLFEVRSENGNGFFSEIRSASFSIKAPFWATWWFYLICATALGYVVYRVNRYLVRRVRKEELLKREFNDKLAKVEMEALRSQMNPHFIFNALNSIKHFILTNDKFTASEYLSNFSRLVRKILNNSKSQRISLEDELDTLQLYIDMEKMRFPDKFKSTVDIANDVELSSITIPPLILQPYVENAIWHGLMHKTEKGHLKIDIRQNHEGVLCTIEDDGIGRVKAAQIKSKSALHKKSFGMQITRARIDMSNSEASVRIQDLHTADGKASGTRVTIHFPLKINS